MHVLSSHDPESVPVTKIEGKFKIQDRNRNCLTSRMDILDPLESGGDVNESDSKIVLNDAIVAKQQMDSDDEQNVVDHLSPQTLLETPNDTEVHYSIRSPEGMITYRVLQVDDGVDPQIVATGTNFSNAANVQQVLANNLNGQVYVIGSPNEVFTATTTPTTGGTRTIAPRSAVMETTNTAIVSTIKRRDERRRATHNEVERRRRDKINNWITKLSKIIPETQPNEMKTGSGHYDGQSKGGILAKACSYILELRDIELQHEQCMKEKKQTVHNVELLKQKNSTLLEENRKLRDLLKRNGIEVPNSL